MSREDYGREYFQYQEAQEKVDKAVRSLVPFSGVPRGTSGRVIRADPAPIHQERRSEAEALYNLAIQWDLPRPAPAADLVIPAGSEPYLHIRSGKPLVDWFSKDEYERFLEELMPAEDHDDFSP